MIDLNKQFAEKQGMRFMILVGYRLVITFCGGIKKCMEFVSGFIILK
jgi:hypothetical protein